MLQITDTALLRVSTLRQPNELPNDRNEVNSREIRRQLAARRKLRTQKIRDGIVAVVRAIKAQLGLLGSRWSGRIAPHG